MAKPKNKIDIAKRGKPKLKHSKKHQWELYLDILEEIRKKERENIIDDVIDRVNRGQYIGAKII